MPRDEQIHRALANPVRIRLLGLLRDAARPLGVEQLVATVSLHPNTVRTHLSVLEAAGLVERAREPAAEGSRGPGRPRVVFRAASDVEEPPEADGYRFLAAMLAGSFSAGLDDVEERALAAGDEWGRYLVDAPSPGERLSHPEATRRLIALLDRAGFAPQVASDPPSGGVLELHRCPFPDLARRHPDIVCSLHLGMMRGAMSELSADLSVRSLEPSFDGNACRSVIDGPPVPSASVAGR
ncbi:MAG: helix-turn-helix domain-containing protein [Nitriliruptoraceae bacterium]